MKHEPFDVELEQALLGWLFIDNSAIDVAAADLEANDFYDPLHARIYQLIIHLSLDGKVTPPLVNSFLKNDEGLKEVGGYSYLMTLAQAAPSGVDVPRYVKTLIEFSSRRKLIALAGDIVEQANESSYELPASQIVVETTEAILQIGRAGAKHTLSLHEIGMETLREIEALHLGKPIPIVKTGQAKLDDELGGFRGGDLIVIPAKSGMGKSALMGSIALNTARAGIPTLVFSLEMTRRQWVERMVCDFDFKNADQALWYSKIRNGKINQDEFSRFGNALSQMADFPFHIDDDDSLAVEQMAAIARAFKAKHDNKLGIVIVDYIQIVSPSSRERTTREQQVNGIARGLKSMAKRLGWPVVAGSQMNESDEGRTKDEKRPRGSDVRESKGIYNESDQMISPYRPAWFVQNRKPMEAVPGEADWIAWKAELKACEHRMEALCLKNRHGRVFDVELYCDMGASAIRDVEPIRSALSNEDAKALLL
jgi:replicative DNA helicase